MMRYDHTQAGPWFLILLIVGIAHFVASFFAADVVVQMILVVGGALMCFFAFCFRQLTIRDEGQELLICFGPLPLFRRRVRYAEIEAVKRSRTSWLDGWGIHLSPGGGWTWNMWGFDCVDVYINGRRKLRIGTDDADALVQFIETRLPEQA